jgi:acetyl esterase/lipase
MDRRSALKWSAAAFASGLGVRASAQPASRAIEQQAPETIRLWPDAPPGGEAVSAALGAKAESVLMLAPNDRAVMNIATPTLTLYRPAKPDGSALLIVPGGGYLRENIDREGHAVAHHFAASGITAFVLLYRLPGEGWTHREDVPLSDAERAMQLIRAGARDYAIDPARVGALGFSAGAHLAGMLALRGNARPDFLALGYPVVTMRKPFAHEASCEHLFGRAASEAERTDFSVERLVAPSAPPAFLFAAADDPDVAIDNTLMLHASLRRNRVGVELHIFERGGHSFALGTNSSSVSLWPELFLRWGKSRGYFRS